MRMRMMVKPIAGVCILMLAACGGGSDNGGEDLIVSDGLLQLEYPADIAEQLAGTPFLETFNNLERVNETGLVDAAPTGDSIYSGTFGFQLDDAGALITGDSTLTVNGASTSVEAVFVPTAVTGGPNDPTGISGEFRGDTVLGAVEAGYYSGGLSGDITVEYGADPSQTFDISADLQGVFAQGGETIGSFEGRLDSDATIGTDAPLDTFGGLYYAVD